MGRYILLLLYIGLACGQTTTIAVFDLENNGLNDSEVKILNDRLQSELVKAGGYTVVERKKIDKVFEEQNFQMSGCVEECIIEIGMLLGAQQIVYGSVGIIGNIYTISAKLVNATSGEIIRSSDFDNEGSINNLLKEGMSRIAAELTGIRFVGPTPEIVFNAKSAAKKAHRRDLYILAGGGSCLVAPIGIPLSLLFDTIGTTYTTLDTNEAGYIELTSVEQQNIYINAYKKEERNLRRKSIHGTQAFCIVLIMLLSFATES